MAEIHPSRRQTDLAEMVEMLLDKGVVINADIAVSVGDTQLLGIQLRAAIASFETAAQYGLEFPEGTDMDRVEAVAERSNLEPADRPESPVDPVRGVNVTGDHGRVGEGSDDDVDRGEREERAADGEDDSEAGRVSDRLGARPDPDRPIEGGTNLLSDDGDANAGDANAGDGADSDGDATAGDDRGADADAPSGGTSDADDTSDADENEGGSE